MLNILQGVIFICIIIEFVSIIYYSKTRKKISEINTINKILVIVFVVSGIIIQFINKYLSIK